MPAISLANGGQKLDGAVMAKAYKFLEKLQENDASPGLHIEPMNNPADSRVRTGRVDDHWRAVLIRLSGDAGVTYVFLGVWGHDEAITYARRVKFAKNPVNGVPEISVVPESKVEEVLEAHAANVTASAQEAPSLVESWGYNAATLTEELGLSGPITAAAMAASNEDQLLEVASRAPGIQGELLLDLAAGNHLDTIREKYGMGAETASPTAAEETDQDLVAAMALPAAASKFALIEDNAELRRVLDGGDFEQWRVFLHPEQRMYATATYSGPFRLSGGAGTGKTVVVLHRARELARRNPNARIVVTTFTTNLADMLKADLKRLDPELALASKLGEPGIMVAGMDSMAAQVLKAAGAAVASAVLAVLEEGTHVFGRSDDAFWDDAVAHAGEDLPAELRSRAFLDTEYSMVVLPGRLKTRAEYFAARRAGRGVALDRRKRSAVWNAMQAYRATSRISGVVSFEEAVAIAAAHLELQAASGAGHLADHVLVDEGQDLSPSRWKLLRALVAPGPDDMFIAEDSQQRIYGHRTVLGHHGIAIVGRSRRLTLNYRTTAQNLAYAVKLLEGGDFTDLEEQPAETASFHSARSGPVPTVHACAQLTEELDRAAEIVKDWLEASDVQSETIAVLVRSARQRSTVVTGLSERGVTVRPIERERIKPGMPVVMTMHRAKGTEFSRVLLFGVNEGSIPAALESERYSEDAWADAMLRERSLLYVAATRARDELAVTWSGEASPLLDT